jgi:hypothetical protein
MTTDAAFDVIWDNTWIVEEKDISPEERARRIRGAIRDLLSDSDADRHKALAERDQKIARLESDLLFLKRNIYGAAIALALAVPAMIIFR